MAKRIHFEDDIFYLLTILRTVDDAFALELDSDLFLQKIFDDLVFVDASLERLIGALRENAKLIERSEQLRNLVEAEDRLVEVYGKVIDGVGTTGEALAPFAQRFRELRTAARARRSELDGLLDFPADDAENGLVSSEELNELLRDG